ncbi:hypothetical protein BCR33DRAFT_721112 [Rhizoclosmatium globosum]|uniref:Uncharacterized protein n=1 Tax=Rhizoclosmatium globosum TaxID=329046 RepID=A0A1Y2BT25_9FUNG|nr:hypothetical protein BCR33DRAFT_721112 [Rhizoclosmatium globosum]|eukprot:ORY37910.1 hypothetical protein BCR33DRAFT_721112 [Rhizoclosmatium globosum]
MLYFNVQGVSHMMKGTHVSKTAVTLVSFNTTTNRASNLEATPATVVSSVSLNARMALR